MHRAEENGEGKYLGNTWLGRDWRYHKEITGSCGDDNPSVQTPSLSGFGPMLRNKVSACRKGKEM